MVCFLVRWVHKVHLLCLEREKKKFSLIFFFFHYKSETTMALRIKVRNSKALLYILKSKSIWLCFTTVCHDVLSARLSVSALHNLQRLRLLNTWHTSFGKQPLRISEGESHVPVGCNDGIYPPGLVNVSLICHRWFLTFSPPRWHHNSGEVC